MKNRFAVSGLSQTGKQVPACSVSPLLSFSLWFPFRRTFAGFRQFAFQNGLHPGFDDPIGIGFAFGKFPLEKLRPAFHLFKLALVVLEPFHVVFANVLRDFFS